MYPGRSLRKGYNLQEKKQPKWDEQRNKTALISSVNSTKEDSLPIIQLDIYGISVKILFDSGAAVSLLSPDIFESLKETEAKIKYLGNRITIQSFDNSKISFRHCIKLTFKINNIFTTGTFYVTSKSFQGDYDMLLGYDYLKINRMILDFNEKALRFKNTRLSLEPQKDKDYNSQINVLHKNNDNTVVTNKSNKGNTKKVKRVNTEIFATSVKDIHIQPGEVKIMPLNCPCSIQPNQLILLEPLEDFRDLISEQSVHEVKSTNRINIIITNNSGEKKIIKQNAKVGHIITNFDSKNNLNENDIEDGKIYQINNLSLEETRALREAEFDIKDFKIDHLSGDLKEEVANLLLKHAHAFSKSYQTLGQTDLVIPKVTLSHNFPIQHKPYKTQQAAKDYAQQEIRKLLEAKIIEKSDSDYAFPVLFVKKKSTDKEKIRYRMAVDYRTLNEILEGFPYPVPDAKTILQAMSGKKLYSVLDLHSAFFQINLRPQDRHKLAFVTEYGVFSPCRLNFGLKISSTRFAELMDKVLGHFPKDKVNYYLDDVIIAAENPQEMLKLLQEVLQTFINNNITVEPSKAQICKEEIEFLGFKVNKNGYAPSDRNVGKIQRLVRPKNKRGVKSLLGLANYFRTLIHNYAEIVNPLVEMTKDSARFKWTKEADQAFLNIQAAIINNPTLKPPNFNKEFFLITDGSKVAISAILAQEDNGFLFPIEFFGRKLKQTESVYPSLKFELLAIHEAVMHFKSILIGRKFTILTDSKALTYPLKLENQSDIVARWILNLSDFDYTIEFLEGKINPADYVSRNICNITTQTELQNNLFKVNPQLSDENIKIHQYQDEKLSIIIKKIESGKNKKLNKKFALNDKKLLILKQNAKHPELIIVPDDLKLTIIQEAHGPHFGFAKTYATIKSRLFWYGMYQHIKNYCSNCVRCNKSKQHPTIKVPIQEMDRNLQIGATIHIDVIGRLPLTLRKNCFIFTIVDAGSRFLEAVAVRNVESQTLLNILNKYFASYGLVSEIVADNGKYFRSAVFTEYMRALKINLNFTSLYKACANGLVEITNKILKSSLVAMSNSTLEWDTRLDYFKLHYNTSLHRATGFSPAKLFFGREIRNQFTIYNSPDEMCTLTYVKNRLEHMQEVYKQALANQQKMLREYIKEDDFQKTTSLSLGQRVFMKVIGKPRALHPRFEGPFIVVKVVRNNNYVLQDEFNKNAPTIRRHIQHLYAPKMTRNVEKLLEDSDKTGSVQ